MELKGKIINFLGDSITYGHGVEKEENQYPRRVKDALGLKEARNYGISGTRLAVQSVPSENPEFDDTFEMRARRMEKGADVVVVFGGTNDFGHGDAPFGTLEDNCTDTYCGAVRHLIEYLLDTYTDSQLVFMTPLHRTGENDLVEEGSGRVRSHVLRDYVQVIRDLCEAYSIPVLDLYAVSGIQPCVPVIREKYCPDGLHPNDDGQALIARKLVNFLKML